MIINASCTSTCEETICLIGYYFWSSTLCDNIPFFSVQVIGAIVISLGTLYALFHSSQDLRKSSSSSSSNYEPLDRSNSLYCPLCGARWKILSSCFFDSTEPLSVQRQLPQRHGSFQKPHLHPFMTTDLKYCPFHEYRDLVQIYGCLSLQTTSIWFFVWPASHPVEIFIMFFICYVIAIYLPFLYLLSRFHQAVEYDQEFSTPHHSRFSHDVMQRNVETVLEYIPLDAGDEIIAVGRPRFEKENTGKYYSYWMGIPFTYFGLLFFIPIALLVCLQTFQFYWYYIMFGFFFMNGFLPTIARTPSFKPEKSFAIPLVCSQSLNLITFGTQEIVIYSLIPATGIGLSGKIFLLDLTSSDKVIFLPCKSVPTQKRGAIQFGEDQFLDFFWEDSELHSYQFDDPGVMNKFQQLPWFHCLPNSDEDNLPEPYAHRPTSTRLIVLVVGIISSFAIFILMVLNYFFSQPWVPIFWYFLGTLELGFVASLSVWSNERVSDEPQPVWSHVLFLSRQLGSRNTCS